MKKTKILIIDKDVITRQALARVVENTDRNLETVVADDVKRAVTLSETFRPDIILADIENASSGASVVLNELQIHFGTTPLVLLGSKTEQGAEIIIPALRMEAVDFITKPTSCTNLLFAGRHLAKRVFPAIQAIANTTSQRLADREMPHVLHQPTLQESGHKFSTEKNSRAELVVIGGCMGGAKSLFPIVSQLPADFSVPVVITQHLPRHYTHVLAKELNKHSKLTIREATPKSELKPGMIWVAPGGKHVEVARNGHQSKLWIHRGMREYGNRPSINLLFRSAAKTYGSKTLGVILSGYGADGIEGAQAIKKMGGQVIVENPQTALVPELPLNVLRANFAREYYSGEDLAHQIIRRVSSVQQFKRERNELAENQIFHF